MSESFKQTAYKILRKAGKPIHTRKLTELAIKHGLKTDGRTPWATMNAILITDINSKKEQSMFVKTAPSTFYINEKIKPFVDSMKSERKKVDEEFVKHSIIKYLSCLGWGHFEYGKLHTHGVDIKCRKNNYSRYLYIETKGSSLLRQSDEVSFVYSLGQIITRMKDGGSTRNYYGLGLPELSANIAKRRLPWQVAKRLLLLIYSVNTSGEVEEYSWKELKDIQVSVR